MQRLVNLGFAMPLRCARFCAVRQDEVVASPRGDLAASLSAVHHGGEGAAVAVDDGVKIGALRTNPIDEGALPETRPQHQISIARNNSLAKT